MAQAIRKHTAGLGKKEKELLGDAFDALNLSARAYHRIVRVARTIADLEGKETDRRRAHIWRRWDIRPPDRNLWMKGDVDSMTERDYWQWFCSSLFYDPRLEHKLLGKYGTPERVFQCSEKELLESFPI